MGVAAALLASALLMLADAPADAEVRVVVLGSRSAGIDVLVPVVELRLADSPGVVLLERENVEAVLREQEFAALVGAEGSANRIALGKLLKADLLVLIQGEEKPQPHARVVICETDQGLRLGNQSVESGANVESSVVAVMQIVEAAIAKHGQQVKEIVAVPPLVSNDLGFESQALQRPLASVIEQSLLARPHVLAVELAEANAVANELAVSGEKDVQRRLPLYFLGEFRHEGQGPEASMAVRLKLVRGQKLLDECDVKDIPPARVAEVLRREAAALLDRALNTTAPLPDAATEARQLAQRAVAMYQLMNFSECLELAEASLLLKPDQVDVHRLAAHAAGMHVSMLLRKAATERQVFSVDQLKASIRRENEATIRRSLPHLEYFMKHAALSGKRDRALIFGVFEGCQEIEEIRPMMLRVLATKRQAGVTDDTIMFLRIFRQWCLRGMDAHDLVQWKLEVAREWPRSDDQGVVHLVDLVLHGTDGRDTPPVRQIVEQLRTVANPVCLSAAQFIEGRWAAGKSGIPEVAGEQATPPPPPVTDGPTVEFVSLSVKPGILGWLPIGPAGHVAWTSTSLLAVKEAKLDDLLPVARILGTDDGMSVAFDGKFVWAFQNARDAMADKRPSRDHEPRILVWEPATGKRWFLTPADGLPQVELRNVSIAPLEVGKVCVLGHFGEQRMTRVWAAMARLDPETGQGAVNVFHEARNMPPVRQGDEWKDIHMCFSRSRMTTLIDPNETAPRRLVVVDRRYGYPLVIDPETLTVTAPPENINYRVPGFPVAHEGSLYWLGEKGPNDYRLCRFGFPELAVHWDEHPVPFGLLAFHGQWSLLVDRHGDAWVAAGAKGPFRRLKTIYPAGDRPGFPDVQLFAGGDTEPLLYDLKTGRMLRMILSSLTGLSE